MNAENIQKLIDYYKAQLGGISGWGYSDCAAGILQKLGIIRNMMNDDLVAEALGVRSEQARDLINGPRSFWSELSPFYKRDSVVRMLERLLTTGEIDWGGPK